GFGSDRQYSAVMRPRCRIHEVFPLTDFLDYSARLGVDEANRIAEAADRQSLTIRRGRERFDAGSGLREQPRGARWGIQRDDSAMPIGGRYCTAAEWRHGF